MGKIVAWQHFGVDTGVKSDSVYSSKRVYATLENERYAIEKDRLFDEYPKAYEVINKKISTNLYCNLPLVLYVDKKGATGDSETSRKDFHKLNEEVLDLDPTLTSEDEDIRFAGIITTWNILNHFYPYFHVTDSDWNNQLKRSLKDVADDKGRDDYITSLSYLLEKTKDGHAAATFMKEYVNQPILPFIVDIIEDQVVITAAEKDSPFLAGDIILEMDEVKATELINRLKGKIPGTPQYKEYLAAKYFRYDDSAIIKFQRDEEIKTVSAIGKPGSVLDEFNRKESFIEIDDNIYYFDLTRGNTATFEDIIGKLSKARGVIFDLRGYPSDQELTMKLIGHLTDKPIKGPIWRIGKSIYPDQEGKTYEEGSHTVNPNSPLIKGRVVFLTYAGAISHPEFLLGYIKDNELGEIVGQATAGSDGNIQYYRIPGGFNGVFTGLEILNSDRTQTHLIGITPTIPIERTLEAVKRGEDEYIYKALEFIKR
ncbi:S41 family peptidase [Bacillus sp. EB01]|uniref:S41 family peptidase n=1 Tax=Bacillus sp. EB01 TaxID=1347086 RepID=UPI0005C7A3F7|nr:S41 family peptidase [Bacillus sp. EB01]